MEKLKAGIYLLDFKRTNNYTQLEEGASSFKQAWLLNEC